jgi:hypothetical protein
MSDQPRLICFPHFTKIRFHFVQQTILGCTCSPPNGRYYEFESGAQPELQELETLLSNLQVGTTQQFRITLPYPFWDATKPKVDSDL